MLTDCEISEFMSRGYIALRGAVAPHVVDNCRETIWSLMEGVTSDPETWREPVVRVQANPSPEFEAAFTSPALTEAYDQLVGPGKWYPLRELGPVPVRFPSSATPYDAVWHFDGTYRVPGEEWPHATVTSRKRGLLLLFLLSDIGPNDAPTQLLVGSHLDVPRFLAPYGRDGASMMVVGNAMEQAGLFSVEGRDVALATGSAGDVYLCHPFLVHCAQQHRGKEPRFLAQPRLPLVGEFDLDNDVFPVPAAITHGLTRAT